MENNFEWMRPTECSAQGDITLSSSAAKISLIGSKEIIWMTSFALGKRLPTSECSCFYLGYFITVEVHCCTIR